MQPSTPIYQFSSTSPYSGLILKREDLSRVGSHKFRYFGPQMKKLATAGVKNIVISTTGNAGITASFLGKQLGIEVYCLMSDKGDLKKAAEIQRHGGKIFLSTRPVRFAKYLAKKLNCPLLKTSKDGAESYQTLGEEFMLQIPNLDIIVNFATSGTSSVGIMQAYQKAGKTLPELHIVQAGKSCSIAREFLKDEEVEWEEGVGLADTPRREEVLKWIMKSGGAAHYVAKEKYEKACKELKGLDLETSWEGAACFWVAKEEILKKNPGQTVGIVFSGRAWDENTKSDFKTVESVKEVDEMIRFL
ncbi:MAG: PLP-dependent lyase/thiolase [Candidatus Gracilibacteria bacterium]|nr:PLP-dependent lyase/thiolase [Candidatus Gracilibacteria bacterium]